MDHVTRYCNDKDCPACARQRQFDAMAFHLMEEPEQYTDPEESWNQLMEEENG